MEWVVIRSGGQVGSFASLSDSLLEISRLLAHGNHGANSKGVNLSENCDNFQECHESASNADSPN